MGRIFGIAVASEKRGSDTNQFNQVPCFADTRDQYTQMKRSADAAVALLEERLCIHPKRYSEILALREKLLSSAGTIFSAASVICPLCLCEFFFYFVLVYKNR